MLWVERCLLPGLKESGNLASLMNALVEQLGLTLVRVFALLPQGLMKILADVSGHIRLGLYLIAILAALQMLVIVAVESDGPAFLLRENGPLEWLEFSLAAAAGLLLVVSALRYAHYKYIFLICGLLALGASLPELDYFSERFIFEDAYKPVVAALLVLVAYLTWKHRRVLSTTIPDFCRTAPFFFFLFGWFLILYAQVVGQEQFWEAMMGPAYMRVVKDEETTELMGYLVLLFSALESCFIPHFSSLVVARRRKGRPGKACDRGPTVGASEPGILTL